jgi:hypothetical protein
MSRYSPYIASPMFVSEMTTDGYQLQAQGQLGGGDKLTENGLSYIKYLSYLLGSSLDANVVRGANKDRDGLWAPACTDHCMKWKHDSRHVGGLSHYEVFGNWYFDGTRGGQVRKMPSWPRSWANFRCKRPLTPVFSPECMGQLVCSGPT